MIFSKLFGGKKTPQNEQQSMVNTIIDCLDEYRSETFPSGIKCVADISVAKAEQQKFEFNIKLPFPCATELDAVSASLSESLQIELTFHVSTFVTEIKPHDIKGIKNIIAVASGKGGVGKSTTAVNLAYGLIEEGAKVAILDADIYGPSIPMMLGIRDERPESEDGKTLLPMRSHELYAMSLGFLVDEKDATVWRGPMASRAFMQLLNETAWPDIDYLIVDMPPGTGDIQLTLAQQVPVAGSVVVTTPQDIALADAEKGIAMFNKVSVPVLGIIENMSYYQCTNCGHKDHLFGQDGGKRIAASHKTALLGQLPLDIRIREAGDEGISPLIANNTSEIAKEYRRIAAKMAAKLFNSRDPRSPQTDQILIKEIK